MKFAFPSPEFDEAVAAVCHGLASDEQLRALNELLRSHPSARDEYILRLELHSHLASEPDLFPTALDRMHDPLWQPEGARASAGFNAPPSGVRECSSAQPTADVKRRERRAPRSRVAVSMIALAACVTLLATGWWRLNVWQHSRWKGATSNAVAMLNRVVDARWSERDEPPRLGAPLEPGWLRLKSGLAQVVFYSGARVVIEGPAELRIMSPSEASCRVGRLTAEVPPNAHGFRIGTPQMNVTDLGTVFGLDVKERQTELHVFKGRVEFQPASGSAKQNLQEGSGVVAEVSHPPRLVTANPAGFASLFNLQAKSVAAESRRCNLWRTASSWLNQDPSLLVHFDFEHAATTDWQLRNVSSRSEGMPDATIVGGQWVEGRWPIKPALEFQNVNDRVRLSVPGNYESLTLAAWVRVQGLDRQFSSLFMSEGFEAGTLHWLIRKDGVLGLTVIGQEPGKFQIVASPSVISLDQFGQWLHLVAVLDGGSKRVVHYLNGRPVSEKPLKIDPPFRIGTAELGHWNARGFPDNDPSLIRNFSGAIDDFCLIRHALSDDEIHELYSIGKPQSDSAAGALPGALPAELREALEDARLVALRDALAVVAHRDLALSLPRGEADVNVSAGLGESEGVGDQVVEHLAEPHGVEERWERALRAFEREVAIGMSGERRHRPAQLGGDIDDPAH